MSVEILKDDIWNETEKININIPGDDDDDVYRRKTDAIPEDTEISISMVDHPGLLNTNYAPSHLPIIHNNNNDKQIEGKEDNIVENVYKKKFKKWLCDEVKLAEYVSLFEINNELDIRRIINWNDNILIDIGIHKETDRQLLLNEANRFKKFQNEFSVLLDSNEVCMIIVFLLKLCDLQII